MKGTTNTPFSLRLDTDIKVRLKEEAKQLHRSESFVAATAIKKYLSACEQKRSAIDNALLKADEGTFISSEVMGSWVDAWEEDEKLSPPVADVNITK